MKSWTEDDDPMPNSLSIIDTYRMLNHPPMLFWDFETVGFAISAILRSRHCRIPPPENDWAIFRRYFYFCSTRKLKRLWPIVAELFQVNVEGFLELKPADWWAPPPRTVTTMTPLMKQLIAFWGEACAYCGHTKRALEVEHIIPKSRGGTDDFSNLTVACGPCNRKKLARTAEEFGYPHVQHRHTGLPS